MKKICIIVAAVLMSIGVQAKQPEQTPANPIATNKPHSMAITFGSVDGISYRYFVDGHWAVQTNVMWKYLTTHGTTVTSLTTDVNGVPQTSTTSQWGKLHGWTAEINPNFIYQTAICTWDFGGLYWNSGAGVSLGVAQDWNVPYDYPLWGKFGVNSISGIELTFNKSGVSLFTESFVGYGLLWNSYERYLYGTTSLTQSLNHFIDWGSDIGVRVSF